MRMACACLAVSFGIVACPSPLSFTGDATTTLPDDAGGVRDSGLRTVPLLVHCANDDDTGCILDGGSGVCCGGVCTNTQTDFANCDGCGQGCPPGASCVQGGCVADAGGLATCAAEGCAAPLTCAGTYFCVPPTCGAGTPGGACLLPDDAQGICCDGGCASTREGCLSPVYPTGGADAGPDAGATACGSNGAGCTVVDGGSGVCCRGVCIATQSDSDNCDGCGQACPTGATCVQGSCVGDAGSEMCSTAGCAAGLTCAGTDFCTSACQTGETGPTCAQTGGALGVCCDGHCIDPKQGCI